MVVGGGLVEDRIWKSLLKGGRWFGIWVVVMNELSRVD